jgi:preprotein translocase subunit SecE
MNTKTETEGSMMDTVKLMLTLAIIVAGIIGFYLLDAQPLWVRLLGLLAAVGVAVFVSLQTAKGRRIATFFTAAHTEVRKVVWPSRQETLQTTLVIFIAVLLTSLFLWGVDSILFVVVRALTGQGG